MKRDAIKEFIKNSKLTRPFYEIYKEIRKKHHDKIRIEGKEVFVNNSQEVMGYLQQTINDYSTNIDFFFAFGTLLGIIRDNKLLGRDMDLDTIAILKDDTQILNFRDYLEKKGFERLHSFITKGIGITQDSFVYHGVMIDINYARNYGNKFCNYIFYDTPDEKNKVLLFPFSFSKCETYKFLGLDVNIPTNPELFLEETYGADWIIPNPNYIYWENPQALNTDLKGEIEIISKFKYR